MLVIPTRSMKDGHIPLPWMVGYHILHFLIFKDWKVYLHSDTSSFTCWSIATSGCSCHCWVQRTSVTTSIRTPTRWRLWASRGVSRNLQCSLSPTSSTTSTNALSKVPLCSCLHATNIINSPRLPHLMLPHPDLTYNHWCYWWQLRAGGSPWHLGMPWPSGFHFLLHNGICHSSAALCVVHTVDFTWAVLPSKAMWPLRMSLMSCAFL